jgi:hypothetical protein
MRYLREVKFIYWLGNRSRGNSKLPTMLKKKGKLKEKWQQERPVE